MQPTPDQEALPQVFDPSLEPSQHGPASSPEGELAAQGPEQGAGSSRQERELQKLRDLSPAEIRKFMVGNGKYKGKTFETLYADKSYVTWLVDHMAKEGKIVTKG